jgi:hypothetical protein
MMKHIKNIKGEDPIEDFGIGWYSKMLRSMYDPIRKMFVLTVAPINAAGGRQDPIDSLSRWNHILIPTWDGMKRETH